MLNIKTRLVYGILVLILGIGVCGCSMDSKKRETNDQIIAQMNEHLESKYGVVEYDVEGFHTKGWDHSYDVLFATTKGKEGETYYFEVRRYTNEDTYEFKDNYFEILIGDEIEEVVKSYADSTLGEYYLYLVGFAPVGGYSNDMVKGKTFQDAIEAGEYDNHVAMLKLAVCSSEKVQETEFNKRAEKFALSCSELGIGIDYSIYLLSGDDYNRICQDESAWDDIINRNRKYIAKFDKTIK